jgi:signal transduction histidine kinase
MISLSVTATLIFVLAVLLVAALHVNRNPAEQICETAIATIADALEEDPASARLVFTPTDDFSRIRATSPDFWFIASNGTMTFEFNRDQRPAVPLEIPYHGPITRAILRTTTSSPPICLQEISLTGADRFVVMAAGAEPNLSLSITSFIVDELPTIAMVGVAFAAIVAAGVLLAARFVAHSISRVTSMALAIDPAAPQGSIPLSQVPRELRVLVQSLNGAFDEIAMFMERQRRFLGNAAHELRTPLAILRTKLEGVSDSKLKAALVLDTRRLTALVSAMLDLARLKNSGLQRSSIDLVEITRDVLADYSPLALDQDMDLSLVSNSDGPIIVFGAEAAIRSAIANLVGNALVHAHGAKTVVARLEESGAVSITDDGIAIRSEKNTALKRQGETEPASGAGLGLSIVREIMIAHGGTLTVTSLAGEGTTARLMFGAASSRDGSPHPTLVR